MFLGAHHRKDRANERHTKAFPTSTTAYATLASSPRPWFSSGCYRSPRPARSRRPSPSQLQVLSFHCRWASSATFTAVVTFTKVNQKFVKDTTDENGVRTQRSPGMRSYRYGPEPGGQVRGIQHQWTGNRSDESGRLVQRRRPRPEPFWTPKVPHPWRLEVPDDQLHDRSPHLCGRLSREHNPYNLAGRQTDVARSGILPAVALGKPVE